MTTHYYGDFITKKLNACSFYFLKGDASTKHGYVMEILTVKISPMKMTATVSCVDHPSTLVLTTLPSACSQRSSAMGEGIVWTGLMKATSVVLHFSLHVSRSEHQSLLVLLLIQIIVTVSLSIHSM